MSDCDDRFHRSRRRRGRFAVAVALAVLVPGLLGCGVGEYRGRLQERVGDLATASDFAGLYAPQPLPNKPVAVRVPQSFERPPLVAGVPLAEEDAPPDDARVKPGVVELPGLTYTYEEFVSDAEGGRIAYYLYLSAEDTTQHGFRDPNRRWLSQVNARFPDQQVDWENVACDTPEGRSVIWQRLRAEGEQPFHYVDKDGQTRSVRLPGVFELYYRVEDDWLVAIAWRVPAMIAEHVNLDTQAPLVAGAVEFKGRAEAAGGPIGDPMY